MKIVKKLDLFILKSFLPLFAMTFVIVLFIVLMQFLWKFIDDLVGKGLSMGLLSELFFYAALTLVPLALPLAILLASLMTFGNLGEKSELTAIKASGISLLRVMAPLIILISGIATGAFFFQNNLLPKAQVKMWTLLFSIKQKNPEVEIPEGSFYNQIPGYNLFVKSKNRDTGTLYNVMIYDVSGGGDNSSILMADSARMGFTRDMRHLYLHLYKGEQFENLREQSNMDQNVPFRRESFYDKEIMIPFDNNFNRLDEQGMRQQYVGKNVAELRQTIDSVSSRLDSIGKINAVDLKLTAFPSLVRPDYFGSLDRSRTMTAGYAGGSFAAPNMMADPGFGGGGPGAVPEREPVRAEAKAVPPAAGILNVDSIMETLSSAEQVDIYAGARRNVKMRSDEMEFRSMTVYEEKKNIRRHGIELIKKFTLSVACLIFFFIGAPLGAIIRKGGLGTPLVISVLLFLVYYMLDNAGYKMSRDGRVPVAFGMWLSTMILLPLGIFVTYKAMNDSAVFNKDLYTAFIRRIFGLKEKRHLPKKEVIINEVSTRRISGMLAGIYGEASVWSSRNPKVMNYIRYWLKGYDSRAIQNLGEHLDALALYVSDSRDLKLLSKVEQTAVLRPLWILHPAMGKRWLGWTGMLLLPVGVPVYLIAVHYMRRQHKDVETVVELLRPLLLPPRQ